jgi:hypothetical protein
MASFHQAEGEDSTSVFPGFPVARDRQIFSFNPQHALWVGVGFPVVLFSLRPNDYFQYEALLSTVPPSLIQPL